MSLYLGCSSDKSIVQLLTRFEGLNPRLFFLKWIPRHSKYLQIAISQAPNLSTKVVYVSIQYRYSIINFISFYPYLAGWGRWGNATDGVCRSTILILNLSESTDSKLIAINEVATLGTYQGCFLVARYSLLVIDINR